MCRYLALVILIDALLASSCVSIDTDSDDAKRAQETLQTRFNLDYKNESHFRSTVSSGQIEAFDLFLKAYNNLPCPSDGFGQSPKEKDNWCYAEELDQKSVGVHSKHSIERVDWLVWQLSHENISREKRMIMLKALRPYKLPRTFVIRLLNNNGPAKIGVMLEMEKSSRDRMRLWGTEWQPCEGPWNMRAEIVIRSALALCPGSVRTSMQICPNQTKEALSELDRALGELVRTKAFVGWLNDENFRRRLETTVEQLKEGASFACKMNNLDACRAGRDFPSSIINKANILAGKAH